MEPRDVSEEHEEVTDVKRNDVSDSFRVNLMYLLLYFVSVIVVFTCYFLCLFRH